MSKWISVEDRLPDAGQTVLVWANGCVHMSVHRLHGNLFSSSYSGAQESSSIGYKPTHWMPLPEPPK